MFSLPDSTELRKVIHKKVIYSKFSAELSGERKKQFDEDISKITITNEISPVSINIGEGKEVKAIYVVKVDLKRMNYNERNIILIAKLFSQHMVLVLEYEEQYQLAVYQNKLLYSAWENEDKLVLRINGLNLDVIWESFVSQISGIVITENHTLNQQIEIEQEKSKIRKQIMSLEKKLRIETQSKKKFEIYQRLREQKKRLEEM